MKTIIKSVLVGGAAVLAATTMLAKSSGAGQPIHIIHYSARAAFTNDNAGVDTSASGAAQVSEAIQGNADHEALSVGAKGLTAGEQYSVIASGTSNGTNFTDDLGEFNANKKGVLKGTVKNTGNKKNPANLPPELDPLTGVTEVDIVNDGTLTSNPPVTVLTADMTRPESFKFMDKQTITSSSNTNGTATGALTVSASNKGSRLGLSAAGLTAGDVYAVSLNGSTSGSNNAFTASSKGTVKINTPITSNVLDLNEVDLEDTTASTTALIFPMP